MNFNSRQKLSYLQTNKETMPQENPRACRENKLGQAYGSWHGCRGETYGYASRRYSLRPDMLRVEKEKQFENKLCILLHTVTEASFSAILNIKLYCCKSSVDEKEKSRNRALCASVVYVQNTVGQLSTGTEWPTPGKAADNFWMENRRHFSPQVDRSHCDGREHCLNTARISSLLPGQLHWLQTPICMEYTQRIF